MCVCLDNDILKVPFMLTYPTILKRERKVVFSSWDRDQLESWSSIFS